MGLYDFLMDNRVRWLFFIAVAVLNFVAYYQDPLRYTLETKCLGFPCKWFSFLAGMGTYTMDVLTFLGLLFTIPFAISMPQYWFVPLIAIGYAIITEITIWSKTYKEDGKLNSPPKYLMPKKKRIALYTTILILDLIVFVQFYMYAGISNLVNKTVLHQFFTSRFGGMYSGGNKLQFIVAWIGSIGILFDLLALRISSSFYPCHYNLPKSWNF